VKFTRLTAAITVSAFMAWGGVALAQEVKLTFVTLAPPNSKVAAAIFHPWAARINEQGKGVIQLDVRDGFTLANLENSYSRVLDDVVQVGWSLQNALGGRFKKSAIAGLPFVAENCEDGSVAFWRLYKSGALDSEYENIVPLTLVTFPQSGIHFSQPRQSVDDFQGLKLISLGKLQSDIIAKLGGVALSLPATDMYQAIQRGTADGAVASWTTFDPYRLGEVTKYHIEAKFGTSTGMIFMSKAKFNSLPPAAQKILMANAGEEPSRAFGAFLDKEIVRIRDEAAKTGQIVSPTAAQEAAWRKKVEPVNAEWTKMVPEGDAILAKYVDFLGQVKRK
jgi:TRAP-type C4-dicarboxylate transport system substrate-binding protein